VPYECRCHVSVGAACAKSQATFLAHARVQRSRSLTHFALSRYAGSGLGDSGWVLVGWKRVNRESAVRAKAQARVPVPHNLGLPRWPTVLVAEPRRRRRQFGENSVKLHGRGCILPPQQAKTGLAGDPGLGVSPLRA
jgi:hypothetical protein